MRGQPGNNFQKGFRFLRNISRCFQTFLANVSGFFPEIHSGDRAAAPERIPDKDHLKQLVNNLGPAGDSLRKCRYASAPCASPRQTTPHAHTGNLGAPEKTHTASLGRGSLSSPRGAGVPLHLAATPALGLSFAQQYFLPSAGAGVRPWPRPPATFEKLGRARYAGKK